MSNNFLMVLTGPPENGKTAVAQYLFKYHYNTFEKVRPVTNKMPEIHEKDGFHHIFVPSVASLFEKIRIKDIIEYKDIHQDVFYGTSQAEIGRALETGRIPIILNSVEGTKKIMEHFSSPEQRNLGISVLPIFVKLQGTHSEVVEKTLMRMRQFKNSQYYSERTIKNDLKFASQCDIVLNNTGNPKELAFTAENIVKSILKKKVA
jgi:guanylate kinase